MYLGRREARTWGRGGATKPVLAWYGPTRASDGVGDSPQDQGLFPDYLHHEAGSCRALRDTHLGRYPYGHGSRGRVRYRRHASLVQEAGSPLPVLPSLSLGMDRCGR